MIWREDVVVDVVEIVEGNGLGINVILLSNISLETPFEALHNISVSESLITKSMMESCASIFSLLVSFVSEMIAMSLNQISWDGGLPACSR